jgi:hypothetical protein
METAQEINTVITQLIDELQDSPYGLDVSLERFDAKEYLWTIRMKNHLITLSKEEINRKRNCKDSLDVTLKDIFLEKFQWLNWETV